MDGIAQAPGNVVQSKEESSSAQPGLLTNLGKGLKNVKLQAIGKKVLGELDEMNSHMVQELIEFNKTLIEHLQIIEATKEQMRFICTRTVQLK